MHVVVYAKLTTGSDYHQNAGREEDCVQACTAVHTSVPTLHAVCRYNFDMNKGPISIEWYKGAQTNISYNCLDRHVKAGKGDKIAMYWEGNDLNVDDKISYKDLLSMTCRIANYLKSIGVKKGDDVTIYMPMLMELPAAMVSLHISCAADYHDDRLLQLFLFTQTLRCAATSANAIRRSDHMLALCSWHVPGLAPSTLLSLLASQRSHWQEGWRTPSQMWCCVALQ